MSAAYEQLALSALEQIGATTALGQLDQIAQQAAAEDWSYSHVLGRLLEPELAARRQRVIDTNLRGEGAGCAAEADERARSGVGADSVSEGDSADP